jgi:hypothetical protein
MGIAYITSGLSVGHSCAYMRAVEVSPNDVISKASVHPPDCTCTTEETASLGLSPYFLSTWLATRPNGSYKETHIQEQTYSKIPGEYDPVGLVVEPPFKREWTTHISYYIDD